MVWLPDYIKALLCKNGLRPSEWGVLYEDDVYLHVVPIGGGFEKLKVLAKNFPAISDGVERK